MTLYVWRVGKNLSWMWTWWSSGGYIYAQGGASRWEAVGQVLNVIWSHKIWEENDIKISQWRIRMIWKDLLAQRSSVIPKPTAITWASIMFIVFQWVKAHGEYELWDWKSVNINHFIKGCKGTNLNSPMTDDCRMSQTPKIQIRASACSRKKMAAWYYVSNSYVTLVPLPWETIRIETRDQVQTSNQSRITFPIHKGAHCVRNAATERVLRTPIHRMIGYDE